MASVQHLSRLVGRSGCTMVLTDSPELREHVDHVGYVNGRVATVAQGIRLIEEWHDLEEQREHEGFGILGLDWLDRVSVTAPSCVVAWFDWRQMSADTTDVQVDTLDTLRMIHTALRRPAPGSLELVKKPIALLMPVLIFPDADETSRRALCKTVDLLNPLISRNKTDFTPVFVVFYNQLASDVRLVELRNAAMGVANEHLKAHEKRYTRLLTQLQFPVQGPSVLTIVADALTPAYKQPLAVAALLLKIQYKLKLAFLAELRGALTDAITRYIQCLTLLLDDAEELPRRRPLWQGDTSHIAPGSTERLAVAAYICWKLALMMSDNGKKISEFHLHLIRFRKVALTRGGDQPALDVLNLLILSALHRSIASLMQNRKGTLFTSLCQQQWHTPQFHLECALNNLCEMCKLLQSDVWKAYIEASHPGPQPQLSPSRFLGQLPRPVNPDASPGLFFNPRFDYEDLKAWIPFTLSNKALSNVKVAATIIGMASHVSQGGMESKFCGGVVAQMRAAECLIHCGWHRFAAKVLTLLCVPAIERQQPEARSAESLDAGDFPARSNARRLIVPPLCAVPYTTAVKPWWHVDPFTNVTEGSSQVSQLTFASEDGEASPEQLRPLDIIKYSTAPLMRWTEPRLRARSRTYAATFGGPRREPPPPRPASPAEIANPELEYNRSFSLSSSGYASPRIFDGGAGGCEAAITRAFPSIGIACLSLLAECFALEYDVTSQHQSAVAPATAVDLYNLPKRTIQLYVDSVIRQHLVSISRFLDVANGATYVVALSRLISESAVRSTDRFSDSGAAAALSSASLQRPFDAQTTLWILNAMKAQLRSLGSGIYDHRFRVSVAAETIAVCDAVQLVIVARSLSVLKPLPSSVTAMDLALPLLVKPDPTAVLVTALCPLGSWSACVKRYVGLEACRPQSLEFYDLAGSSIATCAVLQAVGDHSVTVELTAPPCCALGLIRISFINDASGGLASIDFIRFLFNPQGRHFVAPLPMGIEPAVVNTIYDHGTFGFSLSDPPEPPFVASLTWMSRYACMLQSSPMLLEDSEPLLQLDLKLTATVERQGELLFAISRGAYSWIVEDDTREYQFTCLALEPDVVNDYHQFTLLDPPVALKKLLSKHASVHLRINDPQYNFLAQSLLRTKIVIKAAEPLTVKATLNRDCPLVRSPPFSWILSRVPDSPARCMDSDSHYEPEINLTVSGEDVVVKSARLLSLTPMSAFICETVSAGRAQELAVWWSQTEMERVPVPNGLLGDMGTARLDLSSEPLVEVKCSAATVGINLTTYVKTLVSHGSSSHYFASVNQVLFHLVQRNIPGGEEQAPPSALPPMLVKLVVSAARLKHVVLVGIPWSLVLSCMTAWCDLFTTAPRPLIFARRPINISINVKALEGQMGEVYTVRYTIVNKTTDVTQLHYKLEAPASDEMVMSGMTEDLVVLKASRSHEVLIGYRFLRNGTFAIPKMTVVSKEPLAMWPVLASMMQYQYPEWPTLKSSSSGSLKVEIYCRECAT